MSRLEPSVQLMARVPSLTSKGASYDIEQQDDVLTCSCPAFSYGKKKGDCKHLRIYRSAAHLLERCAAQHGGDRMCMQCLVAMLAVATQKVKRDYRPKGAKR